MTDLVGGDHVRPREYLHHHGWVKLCIDYAPADTTYRPSPPFFVAAVQHPVR